MSELLIIKKEKLVKVADEIRAKTGKADLMYVDEMPGEIGSISGIPEDSMEGLENGYDVMFYDENNYALAMYSIKEGHSINPPVYNCKNWQTDAGTSVAFPYTPSGDVIFYANNDTYASQLYKYYGVDSAVYPLVLLRNTTVGQVGVYFAKSHSEGTSDAFRNKLHDGIQAVVSGTVSSYGNVDEFVEKIITKIPSNSTFSAFSTVNFYDRSQDTYATNFKMSGSKSTFYRLDQ